MSNTERADYNILRYISLMSPTVEIYRNICSQIYAKRRPSTFSTDMLRMRHAFRTLRFENNHVAGYYYVLPNGRCDGMHTFTYNDVIFAQYYCCNGVPHGTYFNNHTNHAHVTVVHGIFHGPMKIMCNGITIRTGTYNGGYLCGDFDGSSLLEDSIFDIYDVTSTYAPIYGPIIRVPDLCEHEYDTPTVVNGKYTNSYKNIINTNCAAINGEFSGGILTGPMRFVKKCGIRVECNFEQGVLHGMLRAYKRDTTVYTALYDMGVPMYHR